MNKSKSAGHIRWFWGLICSSASFAAQTAPLLSLVPPPSPFRPTLPVPALRELRKPFHETEAKRIGENSKRGPFELIDLDVLLHRLLILEQGIQLPALPQAHTGDFI
jgi:hypothetical protein